jgi:uncharacterized protein (TIGR03437 family)
MRLAVRCSFALLFAAGFGFAQSTPVQYAISTLAGTPHVSGDNGPATAAVLRSPQRIAIDRAGNIYFGEAAGYVIRKVAPDGTITTVAGTGAAASAPDGGQAASSTIAGAQGLAVDSGGNLYFTEDMYAVRKISANGVLSTVAGGPDSYGYSGDGGSATTAAFRLIEGLAFDAAGNLYIADKGNNCIRKVDANGTVTTVAGNGTAGSLGDGGLATAAQLNSPVDMLVDANGNLYIADQGNNRVRKVTPAGIIGTYAGTGIAGSAGDGGSALSAQLNQPSGLAMDASGRLYVNEQKGARVRRITPASPGPLIETFVGNGTGGFQGDGGPATSAQLDSPCGLAMDSAGNLYVADNGTSQRIRKITPGGVIATLAGTLHFAGDGGPATAARLGFPQSVAADSQGNLYIADTGNERIRVVGANGSIGTYAGTGVRGSTGGPAAAATFNEPSGIALDSAGNLYVADAASFRIRKIGTAGIVSTVAGNGTAVSSGDNGPALSAGLGTPVAVTLDAGGSIYIAESDGNRVRKVDPQGNITTVAGTGTAGFGGDNGPATAALLNGPDGVAVDSAGNLYIADQFNYRVRKVDSKGIIGTFAGIGLPAYGGDGGLATAAGLGLVSSIAVDAAGDVFIGDPNNGRIRMVNPSGVITTVAGSGVRSSSGSGVLATTASLGGLTFDAGYGMAFGPNGAIYFADTLGETVRALTPNTASAVTIAAGNNQSSTIGTPLPNLLVVRVLGPSGAPAAGRIVAFAVTSGAATLSAVTVQTDSNGLASVAVTLGTVAGTVGITASIGAYSVHFMATAILPCSVPQPVVASVNSAGDFGGSTTFAPGSWLEIKGSNLAQSTRQWTGSDFSGSNAPTSLDGVTVTIDGNKAFVAYISPTQINVQAPADTATGNVPVTVSTSACSSGTITAAEAAIAPGLLAPSSFKANGTQYLVALFPDNVTYVGNANLIPGVPFRPAAPGDIVTAYGIGFGPVTPAVSPGVVTGAANSIPNLSVSFGTTPATIDYAGLAPGALGEYQFTFHVPSVADGDYPIVFQVGTAKVPQTVYLTVHK